MYIHGIVQLYDMQTISLLQFTATLIPQVPDE